MRRQRAIIRCCLQGLNCLLPSGSQAQLPAAELHNEKAACHHSLLPSGSQAQLPAALLPSGSQAQLPAAIEGKLHSLIQPQDEKAACHYSLLSSNCGLRCSFQQQSQASFMAYQSCTMRRQLASCCLQGLRRILSAAFRVSGTASSSNRRQASWPNKAA
eukprot:TRINITY_DN7168_c0_g1_i6.p1 TRINITY_DN7168_c0_g1~~TRINITY_DN7168_c0_g1_i6.p1  ORF type:complete len:159 (-),score=43.58 TRINITY_DN7168_c0_g1_i6:75-551(-)